MDLDMKIDDIDIDNLEISYEEVLLYKRFRKLYQTYRITHLTGKVSQFNNDIELPRNSVLHMIDNYDRLISPIPNLDYPLIMNSSRRLCVQSISSIVEMDEYKYIYNPNIHRRELMQFYNSEDDIIRALNYKQYVQNRNNLVIFNYNPLTSLNMKEPRFRNYKKFIIVFKTILKNIYEVYKFNEDRMHYLPIFFKNKHINRIKYVKALNRIDNVSIKKSDTYDFFFILHVLKFMEKQEDSIFSEYDYEFLYRLHFVLNIKDKFKIFTIPELEAIIGDKGELDTSKFTKFVNGLNEFTTAHGILEEDEEDEDKNKSIITASKYVEVKKDPIREVKVKSTKQSNEDDINQAILNSKKDDLKKEKIVDFRKRIKESQLNVNYNKVTVNEALRDTKQKEIYVKKNDVSSIIKNKDITDKSLLKSSIVDFDTSYINKELDKDILKVLYSFNKIGLALVDIDIKDKIEEHTKIRNVKVHYKDLDMGKSHKFNFNIPYIEENGMIKFSGVSYKLQKQQVILPIVKIAEDKVNLTSNLNKTIVMRSDYKRNKFKLHINDYIAELNRNKLIEVEFSNEDLSKYKLPLDYASLAGSYKSIKFNNVNLDFTNRSGDKESNNIYIGTKGTYKVYFGYDNVMRVYNNKNEIVEKYTIREFFNHHFGDEKVSLPKIPKEYIEIKLLDKKFPIIFLIAYRLGLTKVLKDLKVEYRKVPVNVRFELGEDEMFIKFKDQYFIFNRYPLRNSLLLAGFEKFKKILTKIYLEDMDDQNTYFKILEEMSIRRNYLKGINDYFDYFVDPITKDILIEMNMPTDFYGLLIKATEMLTDTEYKPPASIENFRIRSYELIPAIIYNKLARTFSIQDANRYVEKRKFSIPPDVILYDILQDPTCNVFEDINPFHDIKMENSVTNSGFGGRDSQAMVAKDRVYADDAVGSISESTPDSGKVGVSYVLSTNPNIKNKRGMFDTQTPIKDPINILSPGAILIPGAHQDDSKRIGYISNQLSHQIATQNSETSRVRTGYESVVPYRTMSDSYIIRAKYDGEIIDIDENKKLLKVRYNKISKPNKVLPIVKSFKPEDLFYYPIDKKDKSKFNIEDVVEYNKSFFILNDIINFEDFKESIDVENIPYLFKYVKNKKEEEITILKLDFMDDKYIVDVLEYTTVYSIAAGSYIRQDREAISKEVGYKFKQNEILVYNTNFFQYDELTEDISLKSGVIANTIIIDVNETYEDSMSISKNFANKLKSTIAHKRVIQMDKNTSIRDIAKIGDRLEIPTPVVKITDANIEAFSEGEKQDEFLTNLNTRSLKSKYVGEVVDIEILHVAPKDELHPSIQKLIKEKISRLGISFFKDVDNKPPQHNAIPIFSKLYGVDFDNEGVVAIVFTIAENLGTVGNGDKLILSSQLKSVVGHVMNKSPIDEDGNEVDCFFGSSSVADRIVSSYLVQGLSESILFELEKQILDIYDA